MYREMNTTRSLQPRRSGTPRPSLRARFARAVVPTRLLMIALLTFGVGEVSGQQQSGYKVVVNAANPSSSLTVDQLARFFQKRITRWENGQTVLPIDLREGSRVRERFTQDVFGRSVSAIKGYWQREIFSGRGVPPVEVASPQEVLAYVGANVNAVGYVPTDARTGSAIKVVPVTR
jgi:hypothetical protein